MTAVYMVAGTEFFALDVTSNVSKTQSNSLTTSSVMSSREISDGYTIGNPSITFSGICSYTKVKREIKGFTTPTPKRLNEILQELVNSKTRFTLYGNDLIPSLDDVVITNYQVSQNKYSNAIEVTISVTQVFISNQAQKIRITKPETSKNSDKDITENVDSGQGTKTEVDVQTSLLKKIETLVKGVQGGETNANGV